MTFRRPLTVTFAFALAGVTVYDACSPFSAGDDTTTPGDSGTPSNTGDASASGGDAATPDSSNSSSGSSGCDARLCANFDPPNDRLPFGFEGSGPSTDDAPRFVLSATSESPSPPNALRLVANVDGGSKQALFLTQALGLGSVFHAHFKVRVDDHSGDNNSMRFIEVDCGIDRLAKLKMTNKRMVQFDNGNSTNVDPLPLKQWAAIDLTVTEGGTVSVAVEPNAPKAFSVASCSAERVLRFGNVIDDSTGKTGVYDVSIDDVILDWH